MAYFQAGPKKVDMSKGKIFFEDAGKKATHPQKKHLIGASFANFTKAVNKVQETNIKAQYRTLISVEEK